MKKLVVLAVFGLLTISTFAQKLGHIGDYEVELQDYAKGLESQLASMQTLYQSSLQDYQNNESSWDDLTKQDKEQEIQDLQQRIATFQQSAQDSYQRKQGELLQPILKKLQNAIDEVAEDGKYIYIFDDSAGGTLLYANDSEDISKLVKKKLGL